MNTPVKEGFRTLTEKEKDTLRLIVRGHDAKSIARSLNLSVHTINERLRDARRKMAVSSSREAARILLDVEGGEAAPPTPHLFVDTGIGEDDVHTPIDTETAPVNGVWRAFRQPSVLIGVFLMALILGLLALSALPQVASPPTPVTTSEIANPEVVDTARQWLALLDQYRWDDSYKLTGAAFRKLNTAKVWASASDQARKPLGAMISRTFVSQEFLPAPPMGYEVVKFRTSFANKSEALETVTLNREGGAWRVVGVTVG